MKRHTHSWLITFCVWPKSSRHTRSAKPILVSNVFLKSQFNNLKSENAKATKKRHTHPWLITFESDQSLLAKQEAPKILVSHEILKVQFNNLKSESAKATKKRHTYSWLITFGVCPKTIYIGLTSFRLTSSAKPILVSYKFLKIHFNNLKS